MTVATDPGRVVCWQYRSTTGNHWQYCNAETREKIRTKFPNEYLVRGLVPESMLAEAESRIVALQAQVDAVTRRYEWLREWYMRGGSRAEIHPNGHIAITTSEMIDASIDARTAIGDER